MKKNHFYIALSLILFSGFSAFAILGAKQNYEKNMNKEISSINANSHDIKIDNIKSKQETQIKVDISPKANIPDNRIIKVQKNNVEDFAVFSEKEEKINSGKLMNSESQKTENQIKPVVKAEKQNIGGETKKNEINQVHETVPLIHKKRQLIHKRDVWTTIEETENPLNVAGRGHSANHGIGSPSTGMGSETQIEKCSHRGE